MSTKSTKRIEYLMVEKKNHNAIHGIFGSKESAEKNLRDLKPDECKRGMFMDKTLTPESFEIIPREYGK